MPSQPRRPAVCESGAGLTWSAHNPALVRVDANVGGDRIVPETTAVSGGYAGEELPNAAFEIGGGRGQPLGQLEDVAYHRQAVAGRVLHSLDILGRPLGIARGRLNRFRNLGGSGRLLHHRSGDRGSHRSHVGHGLGHRTDLLDREQGWPALRNVSGSSASAGAIAPVPAIRSAASTRNCAVTPYGSEPSHTTAARPAGPTASTRM